MTQTRLQRFFNWLFLTPSRPIGGELVFAELSDIRIP